MCGFLFRHSDFSFFSWIFRGFALLWLPFSPLRFFVFFVPPTPCLVNVFTSSDPGAKKRFRTEMTLTNFWLRVRVRGPDSMPVAWASMPLACNSMPQAWNSMPLAWTQSPARPSRPAKGNAVSAKGNTVSAKGNTVSATGPPRAPPRFPLKETCFPPKETCYPDTTICGPGLPLLTEKRMFPWNFEFPSLKSPQRGSAHPAKKKSSVGRKINATAIA